MTEVDIYEFSSSSELEFIDEDFEINDTNNEVIINTNKLNMSEEQSVIVELVTSGISVICNAVAGSGKTTTVMFIAERFKGKILQVTYNSFLKAEVRNKVCKYNNIIVENYNSLARNYYDQKYDDSGICRVLQNNLKPIKILEFDMIIIDEAQDMTKLYYQFIKKVISDFNPDPNLIILIMGDDRQAIYNFKGSDSRFLTLADKLWNKPMNRTKLSTSYRLTDSMSYFVNNVMLKSNTINTCKPGNPIFYIRDTAINAASMLLSEILKHLSNGYEYKDIMVLSSSIRGIFAPFKILENMLVKFKIPCNVEREYSNKTDKGNQILFTTIHKSKGLERKIVIIYGFDTSYYSIFTEQHKSCSNVLYVAATRSLEYIYFVDNVQYGNKSCGTLPFLDINVLNDENNKKYIKCLGIVNPKIPECKDKCRMLKVKDMCKFLNDVYISKYAIVIETLFTDITNIEFNVADIPTVVQCTNTKEDIDDIASSVVTLKHASLYCDYTLPSNIHTHSRFIKEYYDKTMKSDGIEKYIRMSLLLSSVETKLLSKIVQMDNFSWFTDKALNICLENILIINEFNKKNDKKPIYESYIKLEPETISKKLNINCEIIGRVDCIHNDTLWEFKCVSELNIEHKLQTIIYAWMYYMNGIKYDYYNLLNLRTGQNLTLKYDHNVIDEIVSDLIILKYNSSDLNQFNDEEFLHLMNTP